jgi:hypothetical protein
VYFKKLISKQEPCPSAIRKGIHLMKTDKLHNKSNSDLGVGAKLLSTITQTQQESKAARDKQG